ncbi:hypothetical protein M3Y97_00950000 [Aphelenchoides bicaudatus]|nr:hypothetical protein M3Y97_00950000 [Aphelenchoides bicaudatus]
MLEAIKPAVDVISSILSNSGGYVSILLAILYSFCNWLSIHAEHIASIHGSAACNETKHENANVSAFNVANYHFYGLYTYVFVFFSATSFLVGLFAMAMVVATIGNFYKSVNKIYSKFTSGSKNQRVSRDDFFYEMIIETVGTVAAIFLIDFLQHDTSEEPRKVQIFCADYWLGSVAEFTALIRYFYSILGDTFGYSLRSCGSRSMDEEESICSENSPSLQIPIQIVSKVPVYINCQEAVQIDSNFNESDLPNSESSQPMVYVKSQVPVNVSCPAGVYLDSQGPKENGDATKFNKSE